MKPFPPNPPAFIGTTLSAYIYSWQSNEEVEENIAAGRVTLAA
jgi:hypothetical protein